jgi:uncharacterized protein YggT (Ycf19 family)
MPASPFSYIVYAYMPQYAYFVGIDFSYMRYDQTNQTVTRVTRTANPGQTYVNAEERAQDQYTEKYTEKKAIFRTYQVVWYVLGFIEVLLAFRFFFRLFGASTASGFVSMIYAITYPLIAPFRGIFPTPGISQSALEFYTIIAGIVYALLAYGLVKLLQLVKPTNPEEVSRKIDNQ